MAASPQQIRTPLTDLFNIKHPIVLAGMNQTSNPTLAAAITNAGGLGVIGGVGYSPKFLRDQINDLKSQLNDKNAPFGVDLLLPQVGGSARKTNYDYTGGKLPELIDIIIEMGAKLFVSAVGVPPKWVVDKLHENKIIVSGIVGHVKHVTKVLDAGADMIIFQGGEGGGHTGDIPLSILAPTVVDVCRGRKSPLTGNKILTVAAGGIYRGKSLAAALCYGADAVWVGTRFITAEESGSPKVHKEAVLTATHETDVRTLIFTGRPLRVRKTPYIDSWEAQPDKIKDFLNRGVIPVYHDLDNDDEQGTAEKGARERWLMGKSAAVISDIKPAKEILDDMINEAVVALKSSSSLVSTSKM